MWRPTSGGLGIRKLSNVYNAAAIKLWWRCLSGNTIGRFRKMDESTLWQKGITLGSTCMVWTQALGSVWSRSGM